MTAHKKTLYLATFAILFASAQFALAQEGKKIYAQKLLDETLSKHKDVVIMAMHVTPPGKTDNVIIASNIGRIGKKADEDDMRVIETGKPNLEATISRWSWLCKTSPAKPSGPSASYSTTKRAKKPSSRRTRSRFAMR